METTIVEASKLTPEVMAQAADVLENAGLVVFPTETVYGIGARVDKPEAIKRLRELKGRPDRAFTVHIGDKQDIERYVPVVGSLTKRLVRKLWPGPLTLILDAQKPSEIEFVHKLGSKAVGELYHEATIGLRCPNNEIASRLLKNVAAPVVAASANRADKPPAWDVDQVLASLDGAVDLVLDGGESQYRQASTIVRIKGCDYEIIREGVYDAGIIERVSRVRILFVCTGNTCRSPMAEGLAKQVAAQLLKCGEADLPAKGVIVQSAGTSGGHGSVSPAAVEVMKKRHIDISSHFSTQLTGEMIEAADHVLVMSRSHKSVVISMAPEAENRVQSLLGEREVDDPIGGDVDVYEATAKLMAKGIRDHLEEILS